jgi:hypothetical protein
MEAVFGCLVLVVVAVAVSALEAWLVMSLWNWVIVYLFHAPNLDFWMAWGLLFLISLLFGALKSNNSSKS